MHDGDRAIRIEVRIELKSFWSVVTTLSPWSTTSWVLVRLVLPFACQRRSNFIVR